MQCIYAKKEGENQIPAQEGGKNVRFTLHIIKFTKEAYKQNIILNEKQRTS